MNIKKSVTILAFVFILVLLTSTTIMAEKVERSPRFNFNSIPSDDLLGQLSLFYPFKNSKNSLFYTDTRYRIDINDVHEWNFGIGYRYKLQNVENHIAGFYLYRDRREEYDTYWDMWTIGGEILTDKLDIRTNAYISDDKTIDNFSGDSTEVSNGRIVYQKSFYTSMDGLDFEIGKRWTETENIFNNIGVYGRVFKFFEEGITDMNGKEIRINKLYGNKAGAYSKFGIKWRDDNLRGSETEAIFSFSIPIGKGTAKEIEENDVDALEKRMTEQPVRDIDVIVSESNANTSNKENTEVLAYDPYTGKKLGDVYYITAGGTGDGSKDNPTNLTDAVNNSKENDVLILLGDNGEIVHSSLPLKNGQKLLSPGGFLSVCADDNGSRQANFEPSGEKATLTGELTGNYSYNYIILQKDNSISGLNINRFQIRGSVSGNININNNIIKDSNGDAITFGIYSPGETTTNIINNKIIDSGRDSIELMISGPETISNSLIANNKIENSGDSGIEILDLYNGAKSYIKVQNNTIDAPNDYSFNAYVSGFSTESKILLENNFIKKYQRDPIYYRDPEKGEITLNQEDPIIFIYSQVK